MIGEFVVTENDARGTRTSEDGVALASYPLDSHGVTLYVDEQGVLHRERGFFVGGTKPFPISYKCLRPKAEECTNLLVVSCLSASHAAYGSVRMEPVFMMLGHAAGAAASLAVDGHATVQDVPYAKLRERLLAEKQVLAVKAMRTDTTGHAPLASEPAPAPAAPNQQLKDDVQKLLDKKVVDDGGYWLANARKNGQCEGSKVEALLMAMARSFGPATNRSEALSLLVANKVLSSPTYWEERAVTRRSCGGDNVRAIIRNYARAAK
jgi:hypothetical protein